MFKSDQDAPGILKQFSLRLDALEVNLEATDNTRYAESMEWEGKFQELQDRVEHHARHSGGIDWESKFQELQDRVELLSRAVVNTPAGGAEHSSRPRVPEPKSYGGARDTKELENFLFDVEQYFRAIRVDSEATKVSMAAMYLVGDAKLCDMFAVDRLFFFMEGLKPWARTELNRRRVNNLNEAIIAAESLSDYNSEPQRPPQRGNPSRGIGGKKPGGPVPNQSWGSKSSWASNSSTQQKNGVGFKAKPDASTSGEVKKPPFRGCFLCQGPHVIANCPQRQMMNAFFDNIGQVGNPKKSSTGEEPKDMPPKKKGDVPGKGLMYVDIKVNGKAIRAMVDTGATHNYISSTEVERLGLTLEKGCGRVKAINSAAQPVAGIARSVLIKIGPYEGRTNFSVVIMDDFKLILGLEFLRDTKATVMPCTNSLAMLGNKPCVIPTISPRAGERSISALQAGSTNSVADALSRRAELDQVALMAMNAIVRADSGVAINIGKKIKKALTRDPVAQQLLKLIESVIRIPTFDEFKLSSRIRRSDEAVQFHVRRVPPPFCQCNTENWVKLLDVAQLCFNSRKSSSTGKSAFEIVNGQQPLLPHTVNVPNARKSPRAISFSEEWRQNIDLAHFYLEKAARRMKKHADKNRRSQEFNVGDKVMVKLLPQDRKFLRGRDSRLLQKYEGPLTIVKKIGKMAYKVDPPHWWSRQLHPVFHVSMLKPFYEDTADPSRGQIKRQGLKPKAAEKANGLHGYVLFSTKEKHNEGAEPVAGVEGVIAQHNEGDEHVAGSEEVTRRHNEGAEPLTGGEEGVTGWHSQPLAGGEEVIAQHIEGAELVAGSEGVTRGHSQPLTGVRKYLLSNEAHEHSAAHSRGVPLKHNEGDVSVAHNMGVSASEEEREGDFTTTDESSMDSAREWDTDTDRSHLEENYENDHKGTVDKILKSVGHEEDGESDVLQK
ncbi:hypothetical protein RJ639_008469 [Escallonia herrerae]|uniref:Tf2-1-like SH3-like domain-containing protein n=1 Tax=Escallonia herrerae TaxID=1293975 RepID=A0AA88VUL4_9ASTE|nr:hypothetical protein RJ639_008469 [Escallonia herrerae]